jgi:hypothetical protein
LKQTTGVTSIIDRAKKGGRVVKYRIRVVSIGRPTSSKAVAGGHQYFSLSGIAATLDAV